MLQGAAEHRDSTQESDAPCVPRNKTPLTWIRMERKAPTWLASRWCIPATQLANPLPLTCQPQTPHLDQDGAKGYRMACPDHITSHQLPTHRPPHLDQNGAEGLHPLGRGGAEGRAGIFIVHDEVDLAAARKGGRRREFTTSEVAMQARGTTTSTTETDWAGCAAPNSGGQQAVRQQRNSNAGRFSPPHRMFFTSSRSRRASSSVSFTSLQRFEHQRT